MPILDYRDNKTRQRLASLWLIALSMIALLGGVRQIGERDRVQRRVQLAIERSDQRWCKTFDLLLTAAEANPPSSQYARDQVQSFQELYREFKCPPRQRGAR